MTTPSKIRVAIERTPSGLMFASSAQLSGLFVSGETAEDLMTKAPIFADEFFRMHGDEVSVSAVGDVGGDGFVLLVRDLRRDAS